MARKLTRKQKAFAKELIENPRISETEAAVRTYDVDSRQSASQIAMQNMKNPLVQAYLETHAQKAQEAMMEILEDSRTFAKGGDKVGADYAGVAVNVSKDILDRVYGKATQKVEQTTQVVNISIDLSDAEG